MILIDILQEHYNALPRFSKHKFCDYTEEQQEEIRDLCEPADFGSAQADREFRELIVLLTLNNIWTVKDLADKLKK